MSDNSTTYLVQGETFYGTDGGLEILSAPPPGDSSPTAPVLLLVNVTMIVRGCTFNYGSRLLIALGATPNSQQVDWTKTAAGAGATATHTRLTGSLILLENNSFYKNEDRSD